MKTELLQTMSTPGKLFFLYLVVINIIGFCAMGIDKAKAKQHKWRIPEKTLFLLSLLLGSIGTWVGMYTFRHKTKHPSFVIGMPAILAAQIVITILIQMAGR